MPTTCSPSTARSTDNASSRLWKRFIDDIFVVWEDTDAHLDAMLARLKQTHPTIKFTHAIQRHGSDLSRRPRLQKRPLPRHGRHTGHQDTLQTDKPLPVPRPRLVPHRGHEAGRRLSGEANRFLRSTSDPIEYDRILTDHRRRLARRGYPSRQTDSLLARLPYTRRTPPAAAAAIGAIREGCETQRPRQRERPRHGQTQRKRKRKRNRVDVVAVDDDGDGADAHENDENRSILVTTYSPWFPDTGEIVRTEWQTMLSQDEVLRHTLGREPMIAYKRAKNIRDHITSARLKDVTVETEKTDVYDDSRAPPHLEFTPQTTACGHAQCETCNVQIHDHRLRRAQYEHRPIPPDRRTTASPSELQIEERDLRHHLRHCGMPQTIRRTDGRHAQSAHETPPQQASVVGPKEDLPTLQRQKPQPRRSLARHADPTGDRPRQQTGSRSRLDKTPQDNGSLRPEQDGSQDTRPTATAPRRRRCRQPPSLHCTRFLCLSVLLSIIFGDLIQQTKYRPLVDRKY
ncbi:uncharacterized protein LOC134182986 [Corticium candelabrum]|uniref:uncharacterized protein LOC134182986 n=1 Tax=Corticium candelabrum TaxID=121492 RepID=UPI002E252DFC|nr:uncharacterized protein LOC134182986 [Corticium candelabrum]